MIAVALLLWLEWALLSLLMGGWFLWLDRRRREFGWLFKLAMFAAWPALFPYALYRREDMPARDAALLGAAQALVWVGLLAAPFSLIDAAARARAPEALSARR